MVRPGHRTPLGTPQAWGRGSHTRQSPCYAAGLTVAERPSRGGSRIGLVKWLTLPASPCTDSNHHHQQPPIPKPQHACPTGCAHALKGGEKGRTAPFCLCGGKGLGSSFYDITFYQDCLSFPYCSVGMFLVVTIHFYLRVMGCHCCLCRLCFSSRCGASVCKLLESCSK